MSVTLVAEGHPAATVRYVHGGEPVASFAAEEVQSYVAAMSGATLPVEEIDAESGLPAGVSSAVFVVPTDR